ncbi:calcium-binding mitochondrial carrier protein SCaMC-2-A-like isoform X2 [Rhodnius prolixus]|uniref:calcium-binding mitochondrial carrier protein SCaMC-2-A-like isoform X2 n=1 Tax=Rhodnius prolixus TaxID=13249 RepID=UPI003D18C5BF
MKSNNEPFNESWWKHFLAGGTAGAVSRTCTAPLDRLKVMVQVTGKTMRPLQGLLQMVKEGGITSMWRGNGINVLKIAPENAVKFLTYDEIKGMMIHSGDVNKTLNSFDRALAAGIAGIVAHTVIYPLEVLKTRMVLQRTGETQSILRTFLDGFRVNGFNIFFKGFTPSIFGTFAFCAVDLASYEALKRTYQRTIRSDKDISLLVIMCCGFTSSVLGNLVAYPLGMVATYVQFSDNPKLRGLKMARNIILDRWRNYGFRGMYKGMYLSSIKTIPSVGLTYIVYEHLLDLFGTEMK